MVNNLTAIALTTGKVHLESDGTPWRPLVHIEDISRAFLAVLEAPRELVHNEAFNVGRSEDNVQIRDIAEQVREAVPGSALTFAANAGPDLRNYRVDFSKLSDTFPGLDLRWTVGGGIAELLASYTKYGLTYEDFTSSRYVRLRRIKELMAAGAIDEMLRRLSGAAAFVVNLMSESSVAHRPGFVRGIPVVWACPRVRADVSRGARNA